MLIHDMNISRLMVHAQQIKEEKLKKWFRETKRAKTNDGNFSHARSDRHGLSRFRQRFSGQGSFNAPKLNKDKVSNPKPQGCGNRCSFLNEHILEFGRGKIICLRVILSPALKLR